MPWPMLNGVRVALLMSCAGEAEPSSTKVKRPKGESVARRLKQERMAAKNSSE